MDPPAQTVNSTVTKLITPDNTFQQNIAYKMHTIQRQIAA